MLAESGTYQAVYLNDLTIFYLRCRFACDSRQLSTVPYYRKARVTLERRQTACGMRHCCARRIDESVSKRKLGCTTTRQAERHPQGVCRIRKAAEPPTAAQQRTIGAEANRIAASTAATPRAGSSNRQALQLFELLACNGKRLSFGRATPVFFLGKENGGRIRAAPAALLSPRPQGASPPSRGIKKRASLRDTPFYHPNRVWSKGFLLPFRALRAL